MGEASWAWERAGGTDDADSGRERIVSRAGVQVFS